MRPPESRMGILPAPGETGTLTPWLKVVIPSRLRDNTVSHHRLDQMKVCAMSVPGSDVSIRIYVMKTRVEAWLVRERHRGISSFA
ncbi:MAG: hypothetical protein WBJ06_08810 [Candidatus Methanoculleus thermohydrogenotrophicum]|nr:hypothetical protein [Candidatus Methanoculleus thermohydrogenotrophicum]NLM81283.1 hypothetical protein [Candidatus Methanoculleus thermohydrogenotrophicum]